MTWTVSMSDLRDNLSDYFAKVQMGDDLVVKNEKKDEEIVRVVPIKKFDQKKYAADYRRMLQNLKGISAKDHPEWATKKKVERWLRALRKASDSRIYVPS